MSLAREVIDRLARELRAPEVQSSKIEALTRALLDKNPKTAAKLVESYLRDGIEPETLYLEYLGPAAHMLGSSWKTDQLTFADVTVGSGRIYALMRILNKRLPRTRVPAGRSAFFASVPEDDHKLGVKMAADLARKDGWEIELELDADHDELIERVDYNEHLLIGLSGGGIHALPNLARLVLALRISAPRAYILVSGNIVEVASESIALMDVDAMDPTYDDAMRKLDDLWQKLQEAET